MPSSSRDRLAQSMRDKRVVIAERANIGSTRGERLNSDAKYIALDRVKPNPSQPRKHFDAEAMDELAASVRQDGLLQPIVVRPVDDGYQIIMGERRYRAALLAGLEELPVIVRGMDDEQAFLAALVENLQRANLEPADEAEAYQGLLSRGHSARTIAERLGISHSRISRTVRVYDDDVLSSAVSDGLVSKSQAQELLTLHDESTKPRLVQFIAGRRKAGRPLSTEEFRAELKAAKESASRIEPQSHEEHGGVSRTTSDTPVDGVSHTSPDLHLSIPTPIQRGNGRADSRYTVASEQRAAEVESVLQHYRAIHTLLESRPIIAWDPPVARLRAATEELAAKVSGRPHSDSVLSSEDLRSLLHKVRQELEALDSSMDGVEQDAEIVSEFESVAAVLERRLGRKFVSR